MGWIVGGLVIALSGSGAAQSKDLGNGFRDHGVAVPISNQRGSAATVDGQGRNALLVLLMDHRGGYSLLMLDVATGKAEQFPVPFPPPGESVDSPYASILSSGNKFYTHFKHHLLEFDPVQRAFTCCSEKTTPWFAMSMTEDDAGNIWTVTYPQCGVLRFNPKTRELKDYGEVHKQTWPQYASFLAADDAGWIYFGIGHTASQIVALDPASGKATPVLAEAERKKGVAFVCRDLDGKVYGQPLRGETEDWIELYEGSARKIGKRGEARPKTYFTGGRASQSVFPDGTKVNCDLVRRRLTVEDPRTGQKKEFPFDYQSDGAIIMGEAAAPDGTICGGTAFPMHFFSLDPKRDTIVNRPGFGQWNIVMADRDRFYVGSYGGGDLLEWQPSKPWVETDPMNPESNPAYLTTAKPEVIRPSRLLATDDGQTVIMSGTPAYGSTGGGLLFWNRARKTGTVLKDADVIPDQSTLSMINLPGGRMLAGTTTSPGTGGEKKAAEAALYIMDLAARRIEWQAAVLPGVQEYTDLLAGPKGMVYGLADRKVFFVFDPAERAVVAKQDVEAEIGRAAYHQGPRVFVAGPKGQVYLIFAKGIARLEPKSNTLKLIAPSPVRIDTGGDYFKGRIYFSAGSHLLSCKLD
ncbi:MAG: hypothetical protein A2W03_08935 [Candidatus Aminicenantes bacterium RBG_16_63_16]|nr:MAG: hypothetical protein A2W03_08935 [Candidatus Aminicenantes bacterium RBG_16_63_16]